MVERLNFALEVFGVPLDFLLELLKFGTCLIKLLRIITELAYETSFVPVLVQHLAQVVAISRYQVHALLMFLHQLVHLILDFFNHILLLNVHLLRYLLEHRMIGLS